MTTESAVQLPAGQRQLFLDDAWVAKVENLRKAMHQPVKKGAVIRPDLALGIGGHQTRSVPHWDAEAGVYRYWVYGVPDDLAVGACSYFESTDGLHWTKPDRHQVEYRGSTANNYLTIQELNREFECVVHDPLDPDPACRYKAFTHNHNRIYPIASDGVTWRRLDCGPIPSWDEHGLSFDPVEKRFLAYLKDAGHASKYLGPHKEDATAHVKNHPGTSRYGRSAWLSTSNDFRQWTPAEPMFETDELDQELAREHIDARFADSTLQGPVVNDPAIYNADLYNMGGPFRYEGLYIGAPAIYHSTGQSITHPDNTDGFHLVQLICSRDLRHWQRLGDRRTFIGPSPAGAGAYDLTQIIGPAGPLLRGDELWFYYTGLKYRQRPENPEPDASAVCLAVLRRDGFISLDAGEAEGSVVTRVLVLPKGDLYVNVDATGGSAMVRVCDEHGEPMAGFEASESISGDQPRAKVQFAAGNLAVVNGRPVSLRFTLRHASLYSYWVAT